MKRVRSYVLLPAALTAVVLATWIGRPAQAQGNQKIEVIHTGDWQSGDEVSFTVRGVVEDDRQDNKQNQGAAGSTFQGFAVEMEDPKGKKTRMPWSPLLHYTVPGAAPGFVTATLIGPDGAHVGSSRIPVVKTGTPIPLHMQEPPAGTVVAPPISQVGKPYQVYSPARKLTGRGEATLIARGDTGSVLLFVRS